ncbi:MAG: helix-turn-helix domain-containing protein [Candidatus Heimdallarchaeaceae archaeon]
MSRKVITKEAFRAFRKSLKLNQTQMADHMGVSVWAVRSWEQSKNPNPIPKRLFIDPRTAHLAEEVE